MSGTAPLGPGAAEEPEHRPLGPGAAEEPEHSLAVDLPTDLSAPQVARRTAAQALEHWRLAQLRDAVVLVVSELVTNAVRHGLPPVKMVLARRRDRLQVDVHDASSAAPSAAGPSASDQAPELAESGRGLSIISHVADGTWVDQLPDKGKIVHAWFATDNPTDEPGPPIQPAAT